jgi:prepilin-type processing-associated H-X9-DG protein
VLGYASDGLAVWIAYSKHDPKGNMAWFDWHRGAIVVKNPDDEILGKMKLIAAALGAFVVGDDGELY